MNNYKITITMEMEEVQNIKADSKESALSIIDEKRKGIMELTKNKYFKTIKNVNVKKI